MTVRAKFNCTGIMPTYGDCTMVSLSAVYSTDPNDPNKVFTDATPSANIQILIKNDKPALQEFKISESYYVDFTSVKVADGV